MNFPKSVPIIDLETLISSCLQATRVMSGEVTNKIFNQQLHGLTACLEMGRKGKDGSNYQTLVKKKKKSSEAEMFATVAGISANRHPRQALPSLPGDLPLTHILMPSSSSL